MKRVFYISLVIFLVGCAKSNKTITKSVSLAAFNELEIGASFDIELRESNSFNIEITGNEYFAEKVTFRVVDSVLILDTDAKGKWLHPKKNKLKLIIDCPALQKCTAFETCFIQTLNPITTHEFGYIAGGKLNTANLEVNNDVCYFWNNSPCGGNITFSGSCQQFKSWGNSLITVNAKNLVTSYAYIENKSKNDVQLTVTDILQCVITGKGNIQVFGQPTEVDLITDTGDGELILH